MILIMSRAPARLMIMKIINVTAHFASSFAPWNGSRVDDGSSNEVKEDGGDGGIGWIALDAFWMD